MVTPAPHLVNKPFYYMDRYDAGVPRPLSETASGVDWSQVHAVRLLGVALALLFLLWAIRRMFGGKK
jgi:hypothetical protein